MPVNYADRRARGQCVRCGTPSDGARCPECRAHKRREWQLRKFGKTMPPRTPTENGYRPAGVAAELAGFRQRVAARGGIDDVRWFREDPNAFLLVALHGGAMTLAEIGEAMRSPPMTKEAVRQVEASGLRKLRGMSREEIERLGLGDILP